MINGLINLDHRGESFLWDFCPHGSFSSSLWRFVSYSESWFSFPLIYSEWWCSDLVEFFPLDNYPLILLFPLSWCSLVFHFRYDLFFLLSSSSTILSFSPVDQSGSVSSGQPLVNAMRTDSALIGGTEPFHRVTLYLNRNLSNLVLLVFTRICDFKVNDCQVYNKKQS